LVVRRGFFRKGYIGNDGKDDGEFWQNQRYEETKKV
jgi:hypothetical protein